MADTLARLEATIAARKGADPASSYVASLFAKGRPKIARKLGEEAVETIVAALSGSREELVGEAADTLFHLLVLLDAVDGNVDMEALHADFLFLDLAGAQLAAQSVARLQQWSVRKATMSFILAKLVL